MIAIVLYIFQLSCQNNDLIFFAEIFCHFLSYEAGTACDDNLFIFHGKYLLLSVKVYLNILIRFPINQLSSAFIIVSNVLSACFPSFLILLTVSTNDFTFLSLLSPSTSSS